ncbi:MAG: cytochrome C, partial [Deltaproteobacteria bacterium]|nr:cytochrome C [Deltaproteobacteria bacterium]
MSPGKHITRLLIIILVLVVGFLVVRSLLIPKSFGNYGHYRGDNI